MGGRPESCFLECSKKNGGGTKVRTVAPSVAAEPGSAPYAEPIMELRPYPGGVPMDMDRLKTRAVAPAGAAGSQGKEEIVEASLLSALEGESRRALLDLGTVEQLPRRYAIAAQGEPP